MEQHPRERPAEPRDPFQLTAGGAGGDPRLMLDCLVEEYARMGFSFEEIVALFEDPGLLATHGLRGLFGAEATRERVRDVLSRCGVLKVRMHAAPPDSHPCGRS